MSWAHAFPQKLPCAQPHCVLCSCLQDKVALAHMQQCSEYMKRPPPINWRGFRQLDEK
jgi:hypothetical protein